MNINTLSKWASIATKACLLFIIIWAAAMVLFPIQPFWVDEWRLLCNLKFKDAAALMGPLDFTQQFPRVYLVILKAFTSSLDYSYFSLRFPALVVSVATILLLWSLMKQIYPNRQGINRFLFVMILVSSQTFTDYLVQIKHYEMEIFLALVVIWQLVQLQALITKDRQVNTAYVLLCFSFLAAPFFSYTYPIAVTPVFIIALFSVIELFRSSIPLPQKSRLLAIYCTPLLLGIIGIGSFYLVDVKQLMADDSMHKYWQYRMFGTGFMPIILCKKVFTIFSEVGSGFVFELVFGFIGMSAFIYSTWGIIKRKASLAASAPLNLYAVLLLVVVWILFILKKIPIGEPKFNAFTVPSIAILIVCLLDGLLLKNGWKKFSQFMSVVLLLALFGNVLSTFINTYTAPEYAKRVLIYHNTQESIRTAQTQHMPIIITPQVAYADEIWIKNRYLKPITADWVLKTFPAYSIHSSISVYPSDSISDISKVAATLPDSIHYYMAGDGINFFVYKR